MLPEGLWEFNTTLSKATKQQTEMCMICILSTIWQITRYKLFCHLTDMETEGNSLKQMYLS